jgi:preprotein translocase subunit Sec61beta
MSGSLCQYPVFETVRRGNQVLKAALRPDVHRNAVAKVGMRVEKGRADPWGRSGSNVLDPVDPASFHHNCHVPDLEFFPDECPTLDYTVTCGHCPDSPILNRDNEKLICMAKKAGGRLISSAGLVNYYESEDKRAVHISPVAVIVVAVAISVFILAMNLLT